MYSGKKKTNYISIITCSTSILILFAINMYIFVYIHLYSYCIKELNEVTLTVDIKENKKKKLHQRNYKNRLKWERRKMTKRANDLPESK